MGIRAEWNLTPWATHMVYKGEGRWEEEYVIRPTNHAIRVRGECLKREAERIAVEAAEDAETTKDTLFPARGDQPTSTVAATASPVYSPGARMNRRPSPLRAPFSGVPRARGDEPN